MLEKESDEELVARAASGDQRAKRAVHPQPGPARIGLEPAQLVAIDPPALEPGSEDREVGAPRQGQP